MQCRDQTLLTLRMADSPLLTQHLPFPTPVEGGILEEKYTDLFSLLPCELPEASHAADFFQNTVGH